MVNAASVNLSQKSTLHSISSQLLTTPLHKSNLSKNMPIAKDQQQTINDVTYKEVMKLWKLNEKQAQYRLTEIRHSLGKKRRHKLSVIQFCKAEDITVDEFFTMILGR